MINGQRLHALNIAIQGISVALHKCNGATLRGAHTKLFMGATPQFAKQSTDENV
jgi:hypothetical protein